MNKIVMTGLSRGGMVSLGLAYDDYPGIVGVINWVGGWHTEFCSDGTNFNRPWFQKFGEKLRLPILSIYGDKDELIPVGAVRERLEFLVKNNPRARTLMLPGQGHYSPIRIGNWFQSGRLFMRQFLE